MKQKKGCKQTLKEINHLFREQCWNNHSKLSASLLDSHNRLDTLCSSVCPVDLSPLSKCHLLQVRTVVVVACLCLDDVFHTAEILVDGSGGESLLGHCVGFGSSSLDQSGLVFVSESNIKYLAVGQTRELELVQGFQVSLFHTKDDGTRALGCSILLLHEGSILSGQLPCEGIWNENHF